MTDTYTVKAPLVVIGNPDGRDWYLYAGQAVPDEVDEATRDRLVKSGMFARKRVSEETPDQPSKRHRSRPVAE